MVRRRVATLAVALLLASAAAGSIGLVDAQDGATATPTANTTVQHRDPANVDEPGDLDATQRWLADRLAGRFDRSAIALSQGEYQRARTLVGADARRQLGQYVDVAGETNQEDHTDTFRATRETQREFIDATRDYRRTHQRYRAARRAGDEARARRLARRLERRSQNVSTSGSRLGEQYRRVETASGRDMDRPREAVAEVVGNVTRTQADVRAATFTRTRLDLQVESTTISFQSPLRATARLVTANGTPVANAPVTLTIDQTRIEGRTGADGTVAVGYRPVRLPVDAGPLTARYVPPDTAPYLGSNATLPITVRQVRPTVTADANRSAAGYGDAVAVSGRVAVDGDGAEGVPLSVTVDDATLGRTQTNPDGTYTVVGAVPADARPGARTVTVRVAMEQRALAATAGTDPLRVRETATALTVTATADRELRVNGTLGTATGRAVAGQQVRIRVDGTAVGRVRTTADGTFAGRLTIPATVRPATGAERVPVTAVFTGTGTNLASARAGTTVVLPASSSAGDGAGGRGAGPLSTPAVVAAVLVGLLVLAGGLVAWYRGALPWDPRDSESPADGTPVVTDSPPTDAPESSDPGPDAVLFDRAADLRAAGQLAGAVRASYAGVRERLGGDRSLTHWEFYRSMDARLSADQHDALRTLIETYERAAFAGGDVDDRDADLAIDAATAVAGTHGDGGVDRPADAGDRPSDR